MQLVMAAILVLVASGFISWGLAHVRSLRMGASLVGVAGCVAACGLALFPACASLVSGYGFEFHCAWNVPGGSFAIALDALSGLFLLPVLILGAVGAVYGMEYMRKSDVRAHWLFYNLLVAAMMLVVLARNGVLFLVAWEGMALASFFLVATDSHKDQVRVAGWIYLAATHLGTAFLLGLFALLEGAAGSLNFSDFSDLSLSAGTASAIFLLAIVGFGAKAGFMPFHVWLPEAHPAAPSHVSALMSGAMIKTGIYGLVRILTLLGPTPAWWGWLLVGVGAFCGVAGVLFALAQHDLKRLLAYSSVENMGIITLGLGVGLIGLSANLPLVAALGFAGALLHVINHALMKGLLFLGAGSVLHAAGTGDLNRLGGLLKRMPRTGITFLVGAAAISGLPPLNGFASELLIFLGAFHGVVTDAPGVTASLLVVLVALALISGLAAACFTKAFGSAFLGEPRSMEANQAHESGLRMAGSQWILAALCAAVGLMAVAAIRLVMPAVAVVTGASAIVNPVAPLFSALQSVSVIFGLFLLFVGTLALIRRRLLAGRSVREHVTWDCGYVAPSPSMQYTASSFTQPLTQLFEMLLRTRRRLEGPQGLFPGNGRFSTHTADVFQEYLYRPLFVGVAYAAKRLRFLQHGSIHLYVLYIALTLLVLLVWKLG